ncbi:MAG: PfkB family carbohydrate kinase [Actinomycetota bacterium]|nr:PfkB family carbohydrate kinase [Actinomycetota bacterium]
MKHGTVFVSGTFNVLHPGHLRLLKFARESGEKLVVGVLSDRIAGVAAHVPQELRLDSVKMNGLVDDAFIIEDSVIDVILKLKPALVVKGKEHRTHENSEQKAVDSYGGKLLFSSGDVVFSSLDLIRREMGIQEPKAISLPIDFMLRRGVTNSSLLSLLSKMEKVKVVVVGDTIADEYISCDPLGMSEEDPTIVVTPISTRTFIGGAAIVAAHASSLGAKVKYFSVVGNDETAKFCRGELTKYGVEHDLLIDDARPTTLKQRFRSQNKTLLRVSHLVQRSIDESMQASLSSKVIAACQDADLLIFSDFNYGCLPQAVVDQIIAVAVKNEIKIVADSQSSSQIGDIARFRNADLLLPTEREARLALRNTEDGLVVLAELVCKVADANCVILKLGEQGLLLHGRRGSSWETDQIEALNSAPQDVAGAGDCMMVAASLAMTVGANLWESGTLGSLAAAIQVGRVGNTPITQAELLHELSE